MNIVGRVADDVSRSCSFLLGSWLEFYYYSLKQCDYFESICSVP